MACPLCNTYLDLKQINFDTAIYMCTNLECPYPVGYQCIKVERNLSKHMSDMRNARTLPSASPLKPTNTSTETAVNHDQIANDLEQIFNMLNSD